MKILAAFFAIILSGCATDPAFREQVQSMEVGSNVTADAKGNIAGGGNVKFTFRDPKKAGNNK